MVKLSELPIDIEIGVSGWATATWREGKINAIGETRAAAIFNLRCAISEVQYCLNRGLLNGDIPSDEQAIFLNILIDIPECVTVESKSPIKTVEIVPRSKLTRATNG